MRSPCMPWARKASSTIVSSRLAGPMRQVSAGIHGQGYAARAAVDSAHHVIIAADVIGSGAAQSILLPMIEKTAPYREAHTLINGDSGNHSASADNLKESFATLQTTRSVVRTPQRRGAF